MGRRTWLLGATSLVAAALALHLYLDNRALRAALAERTAAPSPAARAAQATAAPPAATPWATRVAPAIGRTAAATGPALPDAPAETRLDRRVRRGEELAAMFGRLEGESEADYRARVLPVITAGLMAPRLRVQDERKAAEDKAHVTPEQSARLDQVFSKIQGDVIDFTNKAIADGQLSPYERNVAGWLEYAGGLGGLLGEANSQIAKVLDPSQVRILSESGFEWGEYLGATAPWERLAPPPPRAVTGRSSNSP